MVRKIWPVLLLCLFGNEVITLLALVIFTWAVVAWFVSKVFDRD